MLNHAVPIPSVYIGVHEMCHPPLQADLWHGLPRPCASPVASHTNICPCGGVCVLSAPARLLILLSGHVVPSQDVFLW